jgi:hypothetical protein
MTKKTTRTRAEAKKLMWEYYRDNKASLPISVRRNRERIIYLLCCGSAVDYAFRSISQMTSDMP